MLWPQPTKASSIATSGPENIFSTKDGTQNIDFGLAN
jgi:hypothetical protein